MILITGASGQVGCAVIRALQAEGLETRALVHSEGGAARVRAAGASEVVVADMENKADLETAFAGTDAVYHIAPAAHPREEELGRRILEVALKYGVYFVYHSVLHSVLLDLPHHRQKLHMENAVVESGLVYTIVQPAVFMQMLTPGLETAAQTGVFPQKFFTGSDTQLNLVDLTDAAQAVAAIFKSGRYRNGSYELCGPENISLQDLQAALSAVLGREIRTAFISDENFLARSGADPESYQAKTLLAMFAHYNRHSFRGNDQVLRWILGRKPVTVEEFLVRTLAQQ
ncbi:MAG: NmrA family NAD(P)-binding protein [Clostridia bacterium]|nr:NmrA family NAD(P)-binding protein [Clostridia bacterium]